MSSLVAQFMATARAYNLHVPAPPSVRGALEQTQSYQRVLRAGAEFRARVDALLRAGPSTAGHGLHGMRLDASRQDAETNAKEIVLKATWAEAVAHEWNLRGIQLPPEARGGRLDALVPVASQGLVEFYPEVYKIQHADLPAWDEQILKVDKRVSAANEYVWYERDIVGLARVGNSYDHTSIPMVVGPLANANQGNIVPALVGMETNFMEPRREALERANGKPDFQVEQGKREACERSLMEFFNALWMWGDPMLGIDGLMNHPDVATMAIAGTWASKTALQILDDLQAMFYFITNRTRGALGEGGRVRIILPPSQYQRAATIPITAAGDKSALAYFIESNAAAGASTKTVMMQQVFAAANSEIYNGGPFGLARDRALVVYDRGDPNVDPMFILSQPIETPAPARETGLGTVVYYHARGGGMRVPDARAIFYVEGL